jgi:hypothetical protein
VETVEITYQSTYAMLSLPCHSFKFAVFSLIMATCNSVALADPPLPASANPFGENQRTTQPYLPFPGVGSDWVFGNAIAKDLVEQARTNDPADARENRDREKATALYELAIESQPNAKLNAVLANRIAQMYAFYEDPELNAKPDLKIAIKWWRRCITLTDSTQLLWGQAHMGMGNVDAIAKMDPEKVEAEPWLRGSKHKESEWYTLRREAQRKRVVELIENARSKQLDRLQRQRDRNRQTTKDDSKPNESLNPDP